MIASPVAAARSGAVPRNPSTFSGAELSWAVLPGCRGEDKLLAPTQEPSKASPLASAPQHLTRPIH